jgi:hypothetical protein
MCLGQGGVWMGCPLHKSVAALAAGRTPMRADDGGVWGGGMWPEQTCAGFGGR